MKTQATRAVVAERAGVSPTTVSYVMSGRTDISIPERTRERVLAVARELGYQPNRFARALKTGRTNTIALWMPYVHLSFYTQILQHLHQCVKPYDYEMIISGLQMGEDDEPAPIRISRWPVDGVLAMDAGPWLQARLEPAEWADAAKVSIGAFYSEEIDHVGVDLAPAAREAVMRLVLSGRQRVAHLKMHWRGTGPQVRLNAYLDVLREAGLPPELILTQDQSRAGAGQAVTQYVREHGCPDGIFCHNDDFAIGAYRALRDMGLRIPDDVALVGCDNLEETEFLDVPLSTIAVPIEELCRLGWEFLYRRMNDRDAPIQRAILQPHLIVRESLGG